MTIPERSTGPGRPKDPAKRQAILQAAQKLFLENGYEGTSMEAIASEAGVSKLTLYSHFMDKQTLFNAAIRNICNTQLPGSLFQIEEDLGARPREKALQIVQRRLLDIGVALQQLISSPESIGLHRVMVSKPNSELPKLFFEAGPRQLLNDLQHLFQQIDHLGLLHIHQPERAAEHFCALIKGLAHFHQLIGYAASLDERQAFEHVSDVVALFMRAYARA